MGELFRRRQDQMDLIGSFLELILDRTNIDIAYLALKTADRKCIYCCFDCEEIYPVVKINANNILNRHFKDIFQMALIYKTGRPNGA